MSQQDHFVHSPVESEPVDAATIAHQIHAGKLRVEQLTTEQRQQCVAQLTEEGYSNRQIAQLLGTHERTVRRDRAAFRRAEAQPPDLHLGDEMLGEYQRLALASIQRLTRLVNDPNTTPAARISAEAAITQIYHRLLETVRRLNYLQDGQSRLLDQRDNDPVQLNAELEFIKAEIQKEMHRYLELKGRPDNPDDERREQESARKCW